MSLNHVDGCSYCNSCSYAAVVYGCTEVACYRDTGKLLAEIAALQRTVETLGADVLRLAGENERAVTLLASYVMGHPHGADCVCVAHEFLRDIATPPQPEPVKAHAYRQSLVAGKCACGNPDGPPWHAPIVPENSGTTCTACKGFAGFDSHGNPTMLHKPENACGLCDGNGWTK